MSIDDLRAFVKEWQGLVGALVGFLGVIATLFANAFLARKTDRTRREAETETLVAAFLQDLIGYQKAVLHRIYDLREVIYLDFSVAIQNELYLSKASYEKLGLLTPQMMSLLQDLVNARNAVMGNLLLVGQVDKTRSINEITIVLVPASEARHFKNQYVRINDICSTAILAFGGQPAQIDPEGDIKKTHPLIWLSISYTLSQIIFLFMDPKLSKNFVDNPSAQSGFDLMVRILRGSLISEYLSDIGKNEDLGPTWILVALTVTGSVAIRVLWVKSSRVRAERRRRLMPRTVQEKPYEWKTEWASEPFNTIVRRDRHADNSVRNVAETDPQSSAVEAEPSHGAQDDET